MEFNQRFQDLYEGFAGRHSERRHIVVDLVRDFPQRHYLCRFAGQLVPHCPANLFPGLLKDLPVSEHIIRWVQTVSNLAANANSNFIADLCDLLEAEDQLLDRSAELVAQTVKKLSASDDQLLDRSAELVAQTVKKLSAAGGWELIHEDDASILRDNLELAMALLGRKTDHPS